MPACCKQLFVILCLLFPFMALGQGNGMVHTYTISGIVKDKNGSPLPGAIVFLSGSKKITATGANGVFKLDGVSGGTYELITKMIGYNPGSTNIIIGQQNAAIDISLDESVTLLDEVEIIPAKTTEGYLKTFLRYFIGESANSADCRLLNPEILKFRFLRQKNTLLANAPDFLIIENKGLGYRLKYLLNKFSFNYSNSLLYYSGSAYFEELDGSAADKKRWARSRERTYLGSIKQFFRSVIDNSETNKGFEIYSSKEKDGEDVPDQQLDINLVWPNRSIDSSLKYFKPKSPIFVIYTQGYDETSPKYSPGQVSKIAPLADSVIIDKNGSFTSTGFLFSGYWAGKAIAELLPLDYNITATSSKQALSSPLQSMISQIDSFNNRVPAEKVFIQFDKPYYSSADTIWMKAYVLDAALNYSKQSGLLYTELVNDTGKVIVRQCMPVKLGISFGQMVLDPATMPEGSYTIRAYTNWMQNQGEQSFFTRPIYISNTTNDAWLVNTDHKFNSGNMQLALQLTDINKQPVRLREMQLKVMDGNKVLNKDNLQTDIDGKINVNFSLPGKNSNLRVIAQDMRKGEGNRKLIVPITVNRPENVDLQFMPEGGQMVAGLRCWLGFKAIGEDGRGADVKGDIVNSKGVVIVSFQSLHKGMGVFEMVPEAGESYTAKVMLPDGTIKAYPLPFVKPSGISFHINNPDDVDSIFVTASSSADIINSAEKYSLIGLSGGRVCYAANLSFADGVIHGVISKNRFHSGVTRFTLFNADKTPIAQRLVFIDNHDELNISVNMDKQSFQPKDSIALHIKVTDKDNQPVSGSFSMAITDDSQVKADSTNVPDIKSHMLLTGDLKGDIEGPGYYFDDRNTDKGPALDNLLLTQGWVAYDWPIVFNPQYQPPFKAEPEIEVAGQISRLGGKALAGLTVSLMSAKPFFIKDTISNVAGRFTFTGLPKFDTIAFAIQVKDKKGKIFEADVQADEFTPAKVTNLNLAALTPWYVNSDSTLLNYMVKSEAYKNELDKINYPEGTRHLKEVKIKALKIVRGSHNLNGAGNADQVLDEEDMIKLGKMSLYDLLLKKIEGFNIRTIIGSILGDIPSKGYYAIFEKQVRFVIDGVDIDFTYVPHYRRGSSGVLAEFDYLNYEKSIIDLFSSEDIRGIEVLYNNNYTGKYQVTYDSQQAATPIDYDGIPPTYAKTMYVEITTWDGGGLFEKRTHGRYLYRPMPISWPKRFYKPKYTAKSDNTLADLRSTINWEPNIITDTAGKATVWFYAKSKPSAYTAILQGSDLSGNVGQQRKRIVVMGK